MKNFFFLIFIVFLSCSKDIQHSTSEHSTANQLELRSLTPISVVSGILKFDNYNEVHDYIGYVASLNDSLRKIWRSGLGVTTKAKAIQDVYDWYDSHTSYPSALISSYGLDTLQELDGTVSFKENMADVLSEFTNLNDVYLVGDTLIKTTTKYIITILNGLSKNYMAMDENTITDATNGIYVFSKPPSTCTYDRRNDGNGVHRYRFERFDHNIEYKSPPLYPWLITEMRKYKKKGWPIKVYVLDRIQSQTEIDYYVQLKKGVDGSVIFTISNYHKIGNYSKNSVMTDILDCRFWYLSYDVCYFDLSTTNPWSKINDISNGHKVGLRCTELQHF